MGEGKGFTKFPNELLEKLMCADLTAREFKIVLSVVRYTLGYHIEGGEHFSVSRICEITGINRSDIAKALNKLIERKMIVEFTRPDFSSGRVIAINLAINEWNIKAPTVGKTPTPTVGKSLTPTVGKSPTHTSYIKENNKDNYKYKKNELKNVKKASYDLELFEQMLNSKD